MRAALLRQKQEYRTYQNEAVENPRYQARRQCNQLVGHGDIAAGGSRLTSGKHRWNRTLTTTLSRVVMLHTPVVCGSAVTGNVRARSMPTILGPTNTMPDNHAPCRWSVLVCTP
jgi:hypothetical protein